MALELKFKYEITSDRTKLIVTDQTGIYSVNNIGGWGSPNVERNSVGLYCYVTYQPYNKTLEQVVPLTTVFAIDPLNTNDTQSSFEFSYTKDGWYRILLVALTQEEYDAVTDPETLINSPLFTNTYFENIIMVNIITQKNCFLEQYINCLQCTSCDCRELQENVTKLIVLIQATDYRFSSFKQFEAQKMLEILTKQYKCC